MTIRSIRIKNFQSHKESFLEFSPGINAISGVSDSGKSAIIRALNWVINNRPNGDHFKRHKTDNTEVSILLEHEEIKRTKKKKENKYVINRGLSITNTYKAFGQDVPYNVEECLNIGEVNFQKQTDSIFLLNKSAGEVARILNQSVNLDSIDIAQKNISRTLRKEGEELERERERKKEVNKEIEKYHWVSNVEIKLKRLEKNALDIEEKRKKIERLREIISGIEKAEKELKKHKDVREAIKKVNSLIEKAREIEIKKKRLDEIKRIIKTLDTETREYRQTRERSKKLEKEFKRLMPDICPLCKRGGKRE